MKCVVFVGPTLSLEEARGHLDAHYLPPAAQGDVYRAALRRPSAIGIIDGYFERVPAVWHKEILWAMAEGIPVFGSGSMGALRAVELAAFGMEGVGEVFRWYRDGLIEDDDEVALVHAPAEYGYKALSEPMVNIRATLAKAVALKVICAGTASRLETIAKQLYYPGRSYPAILRSGASSGACLSSEIETLRTWLPEHKVDQKRQDALEMLRVMNERLHSNAPPKTVDYVFEHTQLWDRAARQAGVLQVSEEDRAEAMQYEALLEEVRLDPAGYGELLESATLRALATGGGRRQEPVDAQALREEILSFRRDNSLFEPQELERWMNENCISQEEFIGLMNEELRMKQAIQAVRDAALKKIQDCLRLSGRYVHIVTRARDKHRVLSLKGLLAPVVSDLGIPEEDLVKWYFQEVLKTDPADDIDAFYLSLGFEDRHSFLCALHREYVYREHSLDGGGRKPDNSQEEPRPHLGDRVLSSGATF